MSLLLLFKGGEAVAAPVPIAVRELTPMRQSILVTTPGGRVYRWGEDEPHAEQVIEGLSDSDSVPGGCKELSVSLTRKPGVDYSDMQRGSRIEVFGNGQYKVSEYRLERAPQAMGDRLVIDANAVGYQAHLTDDESVQCIPLDADMSAWGDVSSRLRAAFPTNKYNANAQVNLLPAGDPAGAGVPAIEHTWARMSNAAGAELDVASSMYDSGGVELGKILVDFKPIKGIVAEAAWNNQVAAASDDTFAIGETLKDFNGAEGVQQEFAIAAERFYLLLQDYYTTAIAADGNYQIQWRNVRVQDRSGITLYGTWPNIGVLASDVIAYVLERWAPLLDFTTGAYGSLRPSSFVIPRLAFKERTTAQNVITEALKYELLEWGVWPGQNGPTFYLNQRGEREGRKRWRARVRPAKLEETGPQLDRVFNGMLVSYQDPDGSTRWVGPPGSGCRITSERLLDTDPLNPVNEISGLKRWGRAALRGIGSPEAAIELGEAKLQASKELDGSGKATLTGYVEDEHGAKWPYYHVHAGDLIEFVDASIPGYRYIVDAQRNRASRSVSIELDAPPDTVENLIERKDAALVDLGLAA